MSRLYVYWTHGKEAILESPQLAQLVEHRNDIGTVVEQNANTDGWFHIPISTPSSLNNDTTIRLLYSKLEATVNENAKIDAIHVRRGMDILFSKSVSLIGTTISELFDHPDVRTRVGASSGSGITLSVHVTFLPGTPRGRVEFHNVGGAMELCALSPSDSHPRRRSASSNAGKPIAAV
jgi:hypothetical protein